MLTQLVGARILNARTVCVAAQESESLCLSKVVCVVIVV